jgi:hypothetical protein
VCQNQDWSPNIPLIMAPFKKPANRRDIIRAVSLCTMALGIGKEAYSEDLDVAGNRLSMGVLRSCSIEFAKPLNNLLAGYLFAADVLVAASSAKILFSHFEETGINASTERKMREGRLELLDFLPSYDLLEQIYSYLVQWGCNLSRERIAMMFSLSRERQIAALDFINTNGIWSLQRDYVDYLRWFGTKLQAQAKDRMNKQYLQIALVQDPPYSERTCADLQVIEEGLWVDAALWGAGCAVGCTPCCGIAAAIAVLAGYIHLLRISKGCIG